VFAILCYFYHNYKITLITLLIPFYLFHNIELKVNSFNHRLIIAKLIIVKKNLEILLLSLFLIFNSLIYFELNQLQCEQELHILNIINGTFQ
jgi:hypothetical protein